MKKVVIFHVFMFGAILVSCEKSDNQENMQPNKSDNSTSKQGQLYKIYERERNRAEGTSNKSSGNQTEESLLNAVIDGNVATVRRLLNSDVDVNCKSTVDGRTPLHIASVFPRQEIVTILLDMGAAINLKDDDGRTPLHLAAGGGHYDVAKILLEHGADPDARDNYNRTPFYMTRGMSSSGHKKTAALLEQYIK